MMSAKYYKVNHHRIPELRGYNVTIWIDGSFAILSPDFAQWCVGLLEGEIDFVVLRARASNLRDETMRTYALARKYRGQQILKQEARYSQEGFPDDQGIWAGGFIVRRLASRHVSLAMDLWWREIQSGSYQDQLSLPYVRWRIPGLRLHVAEGDVY
ncbi:unnamed protein product, partial [Discosporangium mesarthrocarpum]